MLWCTCSILRSLSTCARAIELESGTYALSAGSLTKWWTSINDDVTDEDLQVQALSAAMSLAHTWAQTTINAWCSEVGLYCKHHVFYLSFAKPAVFYDTKCTVLVETNQ